MHTKSRANAVCYDVSDRGGGFHRGDANFANKLGAALDEHFGVVHHPVTIAETDNNESPCRVNGKDPTFQTGAHGLFPSLILTLLQCGELGAHFLDFCVEAGDEYILLLHLLFYLLRRCASGSRGSVDLCLEFCHVGVLSLNVRFLLRQRRILVGGLFLDISQSTG